MDTEYGAMPRQRTKGLVVRAHGDETLVLDRHSRETVHCLPAEAARVWAACTGTNTLADIASAAGVDESTAATALDQLMERDLIEVPGGFDRRKLLQRGALVGAGAVTLTGITSVVAPMAAWAQSVQSVDIESVSCSQGNAAGQVRIHFKVTMHGFPEGHYLVTAMTVPTTVPFVPALTSSTGEAEFSPPEVVKETSDMQFVNSPLPATFFVNIQVTGVPPNTVNRLFTNILFDQTGNGLCVRPGTALEPTAPAVSPSTAPSTTAPTPAPVTSPPGPGASSPAPQTSSSSAATPGSPSASP